MTGLRVGSAATDPAALPDGTVAGSPREIDASTPVPLDDLGTALLLTAGEVDLFAVPTGADGAPGRRFHIGSATAGTLLIGTEPEVVQGLRWHLVAVGVSATVVPLTAQWCAALRDSPPLQQALHSWFTSTGARFQPDGPRRALTDEDRAGQAALSVGQVLGAPGELQWVSSDQVRLALGAVTQQQPVTTPVATGYCLQVAAAGTVTVQATAEVEDPGAGIGWRQSALLRGSADLALRRSAADAAAQARRVEQDKVVRASALASFDRIDAADGWQADPSADAVLAACQLLGRLTGIPISRPPDWSAQLSTDPIRAIARASGVRVRTVTLTGNWWRSGLEPMIAFTEPLGEPVVLAPKESGAYRVVDPATGASSEAADVAPRLRPTGYVLYRPMPPGSSTVGGLLRFGLKGSGADLARLIGYSLIAGILSLALPVATGGILGGLVPLGHTWPVVAGSLVLLLVSFAATGFLLSRSAGLLRLQGRMLTRMQSGLWDRLIALPVHFFGRFSVADLTLRVNGVDAIGQIVASVASQTLLAVVTLLFSLGLLFFYDAGLAVIVLVVTVLIVSISTVVTLAQIRRLRAMYEAKGQASGVMLQIVQGVDKVRAAAAENRALGAWSAKFAEQAGALLSSQRLSAIRTALYAMLPSFLTVIVFVAVAGDTDRLGVTAFLAFITALGQISGATSQLDLSLGFALNVVPIFDRMKPILAEPIEVPVGAGDPGRLAGRVELSAVTYRYPGMDTPVLHEVDLTVEPGEFVALVGPSGSGKSTVVRLLLGFDRPESGSVVYDGKDLSTLDVRAVRSQIGVAMQSAAVTGSDILSVITGDWPLTEQDAWVAAEKVGLADDIRALPMGMRTLIGDNAVTFSGGQRQRLVLAAAIARNPRVVILDEATSALDSVTQAHVSESFDKLQVSRVVVAHRLGTIRNADRVIVLDKGRVVQQGTYQQLAAEPGIFQNMVRRQTL